MHLPERHRGACAPTCGFLVQGPDPEEVQAAMMRHARAAHHIVLRLDEARALVQPVLEPEEWPSATLGA